MGRAVFMMDEIRIEKREGVEGPGTLVGYAAVFEKLSVQMWGFREKIRKGNFQESLEKNNIKALWNHNTDIVLGSTKGGTLRLNEDDKGLKFELDLPDTQAGRDAATSINRKDVDGMSFGFNMKVDEWDESDPDKVVRTLIKSDLHEISPTPFPAYPQTKVGVRSSKDDYENYLKNKNNEDEEKLKNENELKLKLKLLEL